MRWQQLSNNIKKSIRNWLNIQPTGPYSVQINEIVDFELNAIRNRIWYRGDSNELEQLYMGMCEYADKYKFWASRCTAGMEMRKIHSGLPALIIKTLCSVVLPDLNGFEFESPENEIIWKEIEKDNDFMKSLDNTIKEILYIGDGAYKISIDTDISRYPILEWYSGDRIEIIRQRGRLKEVVFKTPYLENKKQYILCERYGYGYIKNELYKDDKLIDLHSISSTAAIADVTFEKSVILAVPIVFYDSAKFDGRGGSIFDGKIDAFDAFDEVWSQWMDALRAGRPRTYIPESLVPKNPYTGEELRANSFDNRFFTSDDNMGETAKNEISVTQPVIPHDSYLASYCTALDQCLQGVISPGTLGIDVKKLDNAEAQREKEKATLYTRNTIIEALQKTLPQVISACINAYNLLVNKGIDEVKVTANFGEYANPSFESQVETVGKAKTQGIMSIEATVEELYGDTKDNDWKAEEVRRLKHEQGIEEIEEPSLNMNLMPATTLNGAQIESLMSVIKMVKEGTVTRNEAIAIITSTLGISRENAEGFLEDMGGEAVASESTKSDVQNE